MKRTFILVGILLLLFLLYFIFVTPNKKNEEIIIEDREFVLEEPESVSVITIKSKGRPEIHLSKSEDQWFVNNKYLAKTNIIDNMLMALNRMSIQYIPTRAENETAKKRMEKHGIVIKTYDKSGKLMTDFILGPNTNTEYGTYCLKSNAFQSYVMSIPIIEGGIRNYFTHDIPSLRDLTFFNWDIAELKKVSVFYPKDAKNSFEISKSGDQVNFSPTHDKSYLDKEINQKTVESYLLEFQSAEAEFLRNEHLYKDSILQLIPFIEIKVETTKDEQFDFEVYSYLDIEYPDYNTRGVKDLTIQHERFFVNTSWGDFYLAQNRFMNKYMRKVTYFY